MKGNIGLRISDCGFGGKRRRLDGFYQKSAASPKFCFSCFPLLVSCGAFWQTDAAHAVELARTGKYKEAAPALESAVNGGNFDAQVVQSLYYSWVRQGEYTKAREKFEAWAAASPSAAPVRLAADRANVLVGNYEAALTHQYDRQQSVVGVAARSSKSKGARRRLASEIKPTWLTEANHQAFQGGRIRLPADVLSTPHAPCGLPNTSMTRTTC
jgi:hypothetical protein